MSAGVGSQRLQDAALDLRRQHRLPLRQRNAGVGEGDSAVRCRGKLLAPHLAHGGQHPLVEHVPGMHLLFDHLLTSHLDIHRAIFVDKSGLIRAQPGRGSRARKGRARAAARVRALITSHKAWRRGCASLACREPRSVLQGHIQANIPCHRRIQYGQSPRQMCSRSLCSRTGCYPGRFKSRAASAASRRQGHAAHVRRSAQSGDRRTRAFNVSALLGTLTISLVCRGFAAAGFHPLAGAP